MRWRLLQAVTELTPGESIRGAARTDFPEELFRDHFPSFPVTPGVLLIELGAQLSGMLVQATAMEHRGGWIYPVLAMVRDAKFFSYVPPGARLELEAELRELMERNAVCQASVRHDGARVASMGLVFAFDPDGRPAEGDVAVLQQHARAEYERLGSPWLPEQANATATPAPHRE